MSKWKCEICGNEFENFHAQGFDRKIYCPLCYFKKENQELKKQLEDTNEELELIRCDLHNRTSERNGYYRNIEKLENQQKEFIEYLTSYIDLLSNKPDLIEEAEIDILEEILSKYKSIIGGKE